MANENFNIINLNNENNNKILQIRVIYKNSQEEIDFLVIKYNDLYDSFLKTYKIGYDIKYELC